MDRSASQTWSKAGARQCELRFESGRGLGECGFGLCRDRGKRLGLGGREARQHLAIEAAAGGFQSAHHLRVGQTVLAGAGVDADNPEAPEIALLVLPPDVGVLGRRINRFLRLAIQLALGLVKPFRTLEQLLALGATNGPSFDSRHWFLSVRGCAPWSDFVLTQLRVSLLIGQHPVQLGRVLFGDFARAAHLPLRLGRLARQDMALERRRPDNLSRTRFLEALGGAPMCLQLWHVDSVSWFLPELTLRPTFVVSVVLFVPGRLSGRSRVRGPRFRCVLPSRLLAQDDVHLIAFLARHRLGHCQFPQIGDEPLENAPPDLRVRHLAAAEEDRRLHLVAVSQEALDVLLLEVIVVLIDLRSELDLLDLDHPLVLLGLPRSLLLLVLVLAKIHDPADRRHGRRGDLDEIEPFLASNGERLRRWHDPELLSGIVDDTDFANTDAFVDANTVVTSGRAIVSDIVLRNGKYSYAGGASGPPAFRAISFSACCTNAATLRPPRSPAVRLRTATRSSATSRSPSTSM